VSLFLSRDELQELTGYRQFAAQIRWLASRGFRHEVGADGRPKVLRAEADRHMLGGKARTKELNLAKVA
jgi:hypothetical protein